MLRNFTSFAETSEPEEVMDLLGEYHRLLGTWLRIPVRSLVATDLVVLTGVTLVATLTIIRALWPLPVLYFAGAIAAAARPALAAPTFFATTLLGLGLATRQWRRHAREAAARRE